MSESMFTPEEYASLAEAAEKLTTSQKPARTRAEVEKDLDDMVRKHCERTKGRQALWMGSRLETGDPLQGFDLILDGLNVPVTAFQIDPADTEGRLFVLTFTTGITEELADKSLKVTGQQVTIGYELPTPDSFAAPGEAEPAGSPKARRTEFLKLNLSDDPRIVSIKAQSGRHAVVVTYQALITRMGPV